MPHALARIIYAEKTGSGIVTSAYSKMYEFNRPNDAIFKAYSKKSIPCGWKANAQRKSGKVKNIRIVVDGAFSLHIQPIS